MEFFFLKKKKKYIKNVDNYLSSNSMSVPQFIKRKIHQVFSRQLFIQKIIN